MPEIVSLYCDGGVIKKNPSPFAGTWAWVALDESGGKVAEDSGAVTPAEIGLSTVSNNVTELLAAIKALQSVPARWEGKLFTDSMITQKRLSGGTAFNGVPGWLRVQALELRRNRKVRAILVGGHPTRVELGIGFRRKNGLLVSRWNVRCDELCGMVARKFFAKKQ